MRPILLVLVASSLSAFAADAEKEGKHSVSLDAKVVRSGASTQRSESANIDRVNEVRSRKTIVIQREKSGVMDLEVSVRNFARTPDIVKVDWMFFAQELGDSTILALSQGSEDLVLKPGGTASVHAKAHGAVAIESKRWEIDRIQIDDQRREAPVSHEQAKVGVKIVGWLTRVTADGAVLAIKASSPRFERYAIDEQRKELIESSADRIGKFAQ